MDTDLHFPSLKSWRVYISMQKQFSVSDLWRVPVLNVHVLYLNLRDWQYLNKHCIRKFKAVSQFTQEPKTILTSYVKNSINKNGSSVCLTCTQSKWIRKENQELSISTKNAMYFTRNTDDKYIQHLNLQLSTYN